MVCMVRNMNDYLLDFNDAVRFMDDDLFDELCREFDGLSEQEFFSAYERKHLDFFHDLWELSKSNPQW